MTKQVMKTYVVVGGKWFDKVNGNTYHSAKVIDTETGNIEYTRFCYGYGQQYIHSAEEHIRATYKGQYKLIDGGSFYLNKREVKNGWF